MTVDLLLASKAARFESAVMPPLDVLGAAPAPAFDRVVRLTASTLNVPIAWISVFDGERAWFLSRVGTDVTHSARSISFGAAAARHDGDILEIPDVASDGRFDEHPFVNGDVPITSYAGRVLRAPDGLAVGSLNVATTTPRTLSDDDRQALIDFAALAEELFRARLELFETTTAGSPADDESGNPDLRRRLDALELVLHHVSDAVVVLDGAARLTFTSPSFGRIFAYADDHQPTSSALELFHPDDRSLVTASITAAIAEDTPQTFTGRVFTEAGEIRNVECVAENHFGQQSVGGVVLVIRDVSERHLLSQMLAFQSTHDRLTELPNRILFREHLVPALARAGRDARSVAVCAFELADLGGLNDRLGFAAGDELLIDIATRLRASIRSGDSAARLGATQFVVLLDPIGDEDEAAKVAQRLVATLSGRRSLGAGETDCAVAAGIALSRPDEDAEALVARAVRALAALGEHSVD